jgi:hypothetical protein
MCLRIGCYARIRAQYQTAAIRLDYVPPHIPVDVQVFFAFDLTIDSGLRTDARENERFRLPVLCLVLT